MCNLCIEKLPELFAQIIKMQSKISKYTYKNGKTTT